MIELDNDLGQVVRFEGELLVDDDTSGPGKPRWIQVEVWRTSAGNYVLRRTTHYANGDDPYVLFEVWKTPEQLIDSFATVNQRTRAKHHSGFAGSLLTAISEKDPAVAALWTDINVP